MFSISVLSFAEIILVFKIIFNLINIAIKVNSLGIYDKLVGYRVPWRCRKCLQLILPHSSRKQREVVLI